MSYDGNIQIAGLTLAVNPEQYVQKFVKAHMNVSATPSPRSRSSMLESDNSVEKEYSRRYSGDHYIYWADNTLHFRSPDIRPN